MAVTSAPDVRTVETAYGSVRVRDTGGSGTPLLLVHALLVDGDLFSRLVPLLTAQGHRCLVPEMPLGAHEIPLHQDADLTPVGLAQLLVEVLDALEVSRAHLVGVDTGGALSQLLMAHHRERVGRVILTACDAYEAFPPRILRVMLAPLRAPGALWMTAQLAKLRFVRGLTSPRPLTHSDIDDATVKRWASPMLTRGVRRDLRKVITGMHSGFTLDAAELNRDFPNPVLIAWGDDDRIFPHRLAERLAADLPHSRLITITDCAAFAALDQPAVLAALIHGHVAAAVQ